MLQVLVRISLLFTVSLLITCGGGGGGDGGEADVSDIPVTTVDYVFSISAEQVMSGAPAPAGASGTANFQTRNRSTFEMYASGTVTLSGIDATSVDIHAGYAGETGSMLMSLQQTDATTWSIPANTELDEEDFRQLEQTGFYVLVSSAQGQLRGQILSDDWEITFFELSGDEIVPAEDVSGSGKGAISVATGFTNGRYTYHLRVTTTGITDAVGATLSEAFAGTNGGSLFTLEQSTVNSEVWGSRDVNDPNLFPYFSDTGLEALMAGEYYVEVETTGNSAGPIRGQIVPEGVEVYWVPLSTDEVVGTAPVSSGLATADITYRPSTGDMAINLYLNDFLSTPLSVELHQAPFGENGPIQYSLLQDFSLNGLWSLSNTALPTDLQTALDNQQLYLTVTTSDYPGGELRGQIIVGSNEPVTSSTVSQSGGKLLLNDPAGSSFELNLPSGALVDDTVITMERTTLPDNFPAGIKPISAVSLGPNGTTFSAAPIITVTGDSTSSTGGARAGYIIGSDGTIEYTPLLGDDLIAAALPGNQPGSFKVPHFSTVGLVEVDPFGSGLPEENDTIIPAAKTKQKIAAILTDAANKQMAGIDDVNINFDELENIFSSWSNSILNNAQSLGNGNFIVFMGFIDEIVEYHELRQMTGLGSHYSLSEQLFDPLWADFTSAMTRLDSDCLAGNGFASTAAIPWVIGFNRYFPDTQTELFESSKIKINCLFSVKLSTDAVLASFQGDNIDSIQVSATILDPYGDDVTDIAGPLLDPTWHSPEGVNQALGTHVFMDTSTLGRHKAVLTLNYFEANTSATVLVIPDIRGRLSITPDAVAEGCDLERYYPGNETEYRELGDLFEGPQFELEFHAEPLLIVDDDKVLVSFSADRLVFQSFTINNFWIDAIFDNFEEHSVTGLANGSVAFHSIEWKPNGGFDVTPRSIEITDGEISDGFITFNSINSTDGSGCSFVGYISINVGGVPL